MKAKDRCSAIFFIIKRPIRPRPGPNLQRTKIIEKKLQEIGYHIKTAILDTNKITNIPQHRERIYIIGFRDKEKYDKQFSKTIILTKNPTKLAKSL